MTTKQKSFGFIFHFLFLIDFVHSSANYNYNVKNSWIGGFTGSFTFTPERPIQNGWTLRFQYGEPMLSRFECWNAVEKGSSLTNGKKEFTIVNPEYKPSINAGETYEIGFNALFEDTTASTPPPVTILLQGRIVYRSPEISGPKTPAFVVPTTDMAYIINSLSRRPFITRSPGMFDPFNFINNNNNNNSNNNNNNDDSIFTPNDNKVNKNLNPNQQQQNHNKKQNNNNNNNQQQQNNNQQQQNNNQQQQNNNNQGQSNKGKQNKNNQQQQEGSGGVPETTQSPTETTTLSEKRTTTTPKKPIYTVTTKYDYAAVLHKSILFYEAQRSGKLPPSNRIPWRGDSGMFDRGDNNEDLTGGYYDAGDHVKFGFPMAFSVTVLAWGVIEYWDAYEATGELPYALEQLRWGADYIMKAHVSPFVLYGQVGDATVDHKSWERPERMRGMRPSYKISKKNPGSDLAAESAAALAATSLAVRRTNNGRESKYVKRLLSHANNLLIFANTFQRLYHLSIPDAKKFYKSTGFRDEIMWATAWMYRATGNPKLLEKAQGRFMNWAMFSLPKHLRFSWDEKRPGIQVLMAQIDPTMKVQHEANVQTYCSTLRSAKGKYTKKGLLFLDEWSPLRYAANAAFLCFMAADMGIQPAINNAWATKQIHYMLGDTGRSYVVGFGKNDPKRPHHRASSCPAKQNQGCGFQYANTKQPNPNILQGALVGGPDYLDKFKDSRKDYKQNEVALDYNAGFQGAIAALQYRKMFPTSRIARSNEPWYINVNGTPTPKVGGGRGGSDRVGSPSVLHAAVLMFLALFGHFMNA